MRRVLAVGSAPATEMLALPEPERFKAMLLDAEEQLEIMWGAADAVG